MAEQWPKRYEPSDRKLEYLRRRGSHPSSSMASALLALACGLGAVLLVGQRVMLQPLSELVGLSLRSPQMPAEALLQYTAKALTVAGLAILPVGLATLAGWLVGNSLQTGLALRWPWSSPSGPTYYTIPRRHTADTAVRGLLAALLLAAIIVTVAGVCQAAAELPLGADLAFSRICYTCLRPVLSTFFPALVAVVILDVVWSRYSYVAAARMTESERRREAEETSIGWLTKRRRERLRRHGGT